MKGYCGEGGWISYPSGNDGLMGTRPQTSPGNGLGDLGMGNETDRQDGADTRKAENIRSQLQDMKEISRLDVIVIGDTALVGYTPSDATRDTNSIRHMVENRVRQIDRTIDTVIASEAPDIMTKMQRLSDDIANNRPMNEITEEFRRLTKNNNQTR